MRPEYRGAGSFLYSEGHRICISASHGKGLTKRGVESQRRQGETYLTRRAAAACWKSRLWHVGFQPNPLNKGARQGFVGKPSFGRCERVFSTWKTLIYGKSAARASADLQKAFGDFGHIYQLLGDRMSREKPGTLQNKMLRFSQKKTI